NWAITSSTAIITIAFANAAVPHIIFFFNLAIVWVMLWIEARRYRFYDAFRARIRMLEAHFLVPRVMENRDLLQGEWKKLVCEDLILPCFKVSRLEAIGRRLKRNYVLRKQKIFRRNFGVRDTPLTLAHLKKLIVES